MNTLLEKAKAVKTPRKAHKKTVTVQDCEAALAWAKGEITTTQLGRALGYGGKASANLATATNYFLIKCFRFMVQYGLLVKYDKPVIVPEEISEKKVLTYHMKRSCPRCGNPIADNVSLARKFCSDLCKSRYHKGK